MRCIELKTRPQNSGKSPYLRDVLIPVNTRTSPLSIANMKPP